MILKFRNSRTLELVFLASLMVTIVCASVNFGSSSSLNCMHPLARRVLPARFWIRMKWMMVTPVWTAEVRVFALTGRLRLCLQSWGPHSSFLYSKKNWGLERCQRLSLERCLLSRLPKT